MRKILRSLFVLCLALIGTSSWAQTTVTFDATTNLGSSTSRGEGSVTLDGVTISNTDGILGNGSEYRFYQNSTTTVTSTVGNITNIEFTCTASGTSKYGPGNFTSDAGSYTYSEKVGTWTGSAATVTFTASGAQVRATQIVVTIGDGSGTSKLNAGLTFSDDYVAICKDTIDKFVAPTLTKSTTADVVYSVTSNGVANVSSDGTITLTGTLGRDTITATTAENDEYYAGSATFIVNVFAYNYFKKATTVTAGNSYLLAYPQATDSIFYAYPLSSSKSYGYLTGGVATPNDDGLIAVRSDYDDTFTFVADGDNFNIVQPDGRMLYLSGSYASFNVDEAPDANYTWSVSLDESGNATIQNTGNSKYIVYALYNGKGEFKVDTAVGDLPVLYELDEEATKIDGVVDQTVKTNDDAIYNLAGQRVDENYKGVVIRNGKKYINK
ncbi:MAG: hypothetical protein ACOYJF_00815 [Prevotella sp.]|jgi:hypothetical protein